MPLISSDLKALNAALAAITMITERLANENVELRRALEEISTLDSGTADLTDVAANIARQALKCP